jgi:hypothetical protein
MILTEESEREERRPLIIVKRLVFVHDTDVNLSQSSLSLDKTLSLSSRISCVAAASAAGVLTVGTVCKCEVTLHSCHECVYDEKLCVKTNLV